MFPVYKKLKTKEDIDLAWVNSSQHDVLIEDQEKFFNIKADHKFSKLDSKPESRLAGLGAHILNEATELFLKEKPDLIFVQGDTLTTQYCALAAFYLKIKIAHIEAGLRTTDITNPFPEELSRRVISQIADLNFAPELKALENLEMEKALYKKSSFNFYTGNTVIDTLSYCMQELDDGDLHEDLKGQKYILLTCHRRENLDGAIGNLFNACTRIAQNPSCKDIKLVFIRHKNPQAQKLYDEYQEFCKKEKLNQILFLDPVSYPKFLVLMKNSFFIVTDSGGVQEEAPYLQKPVLVFREQTERLAGLDLGLAKLVGTKENLIHGEMLDLATNETRFKKMVETGLQPYGDGLAADRIVDSTILYLKK